ncbi:MAG: hypothetical protein HQ472_07255 [Ignavibacteria bacterium]|nr:hypothetical protein [Ignavibacteria bacterium]
MTKSQTLVNMGATITLTGGARMFVSGNTVNEKGKIDVLDLARITFDGDVTIKRDGIYFYKDAFGTITKDLDIKLDGVCWRYKPGTLNVFGTIRNDGELNNDGEINIGKP